MYSIKFSLFLNYNISIMKKNIIIVIKFCIIILSIILSYSFIDKTFNPRMYAEALEAKELLYKNENFSIIIMGNSHARYAFDSNILNDISIEENYLNISIAGIGFPTTYFHLNHMINCGEIPDIIILESFTLLDESNGNSLRAMNNNIIKTFIEIHKNIPINNQNVAYSSINNNRYNKWTELLNIAQKNYSYYSLLEDFKRYKKLPFPSNIISEEDYIKGFQKGYETINNNNLNLLTSFIELCNEYNITLILVRAPTVNSLGFIDKNMENLAKQENLIFIDLNKDIFSNLENPRIIFNDIQFLENGLINSHTNRNGAIYSSLMLSQELEKNNLIDINSYSFNEYWSIFEENITVK